jgi:hypothetical protein
MHGADCTWRHLTSRSPGHRAPDLCLIISGPLHQVSYSYHNPHCYLSCRTCHLHTTRQANTILHTNKSNSVEASKCLRFEFKSRHVNNSSQSNQYTNHLISQYMVDQLIKLLFIFLNRPTLLKMQQFSGLNSMSILLKLKRHSINKMLPRVNSSRMFVNLKPIRGSINHVYGSRIHPKIWRNPIQMKVCRALIQPDPNIRLIETWEFHFRQPWAPGFRLRTMMM